MHTVPQFKWKDFGVAFMTTAGQYLENCAHHHTNLKYTRIPPNWRKVTLKGVVRLKISVKLSVTVIGW